MADLLWAALWYLQSGADQALPYVPPLSDQSHIELELGPTVIIGLVGLFAWWVKQQGRKE